MARFTPGPWVLNHGGGATCVEAVAGSINICRVTAHHQLANADLIAAAPDLFVACDAADTAFAVMQISNLTPQARSALREAWPLVQAARAKAVPDGAYAEVIAEAHRHEIARLDAVVKRLVAAVEGMIEVFDDDAGPLECLAVAKTALRMAAGDGPCPVCLDSGIRSYGLGGEAGVQDGACDNCGGSR